MRTAIRILSAHQRHIALALLTAFCLLAASTAFSQSTAFTYQGKLSDNDNPASGQYDFQFKLYDTNTVGTGAQHGSMFSVSNVTVTNGIFTAQLDFGTCASCFDGSVRFLEIAVKQTSGSTFTTLGPRQPIASTPYAMRTLNATASDGLSTACVNCVTSSQIGSVSGSAVSGAIPVASVPAGSGDYIQNTTSQQTTSNFNVSGSGTIGGVLSASTVNATTQYNIGGQRVLSVNSFFQNTAAGIVAGPANAGFHNSFFGGSSGHDTNGGGDNSFFGYRAGFSNQGGSKNTIIGSFAAVGSANLTNATAIGSNTRVGCDNCMVLGSINGVNGATASVNVGIGTPNPSAKLHVVDSDDLSTADIALFFANNLTQGLGIGYNRIEALGSISDQHILLLPKGAGNVGIGTTGPLATLHLERDGDIGADWQNAQLRISGRTDTAMQLNLGYDTTNNRGVIQAGQASVAFKDLLLNPSGGNIGIGVSAPTFQLQLSADSAAKPNGGSWSNPSDARLKNDIHPFTDGLSVLRNINPVSYRLNGKAGLPKGEPGIGVIAQEVRDLLPYTITTFKAKLEAGDTEPAELLAFNSSALTFVLINAVKELSARLDALEASNKQAAVAALRQENEAQKQRIADLERRLAVLEQMMKKLIEKP